MDKIVIAVCIVLSGTAVWGQQPIPAKTTRDSTTPVVAKPLIIDPVAKLPPDERELYRQWHQNLMHYNNLLIQAQGEYSRAEAQKGYNLAYYMCSVLLSGRYKQWQIEEGRRQEAERLKQEMANRIASGYISLSDMQAICIGMTDVQVVNAFGRPDSVFQITDEAWIYNKLRKRDQLTGARVSFTLTMRDGVCVDVSASKFKW